MSYFKASHWAEPGFMVEADDSSKAVFIALKWLIMNPPRGCRILWDEVLVSGPVSKVPDGCKVVRMIDGRPFGFRNSNNYRR